jgi:hypothetical protein
MQTELSKPNNVGFGRRDTKSDAVEFHTANVKVSSFVWIEVKSTGKLLGKRCLHFVAYQAKTSEF